MKLNGLIKKDIITVILANLKAEMNKLEIIDGMLMESMIESLEWTAEDELEPLAIEQTSFLFFSALPNELKEEMELLTALAAQGNSPAFNHQLIHQSSIHKVKLIGLIERDWWNWSAAVPLVIEWRNQLLLACFLWVGYRLAGQPMAPPKGSEPSQEKQLMESWNQLFRKLNLWNLWVMGASAPLPRANSIPEQLSFSSISSLLPILCWIEERRPAAEVKLSLVY